jgi:hypothetical protein
MSRQLVFEGASFSSDVPISRGPRERTRVCLGAFTGAIHCDIVHLHPWDLIAPLFLSAGWGVAHAILSASVFLCNNACPADLLCTSPPNESPRDIPFRKNALETAQHSCFSPRHHSSPPFWPCGVDFLIRPTSVTEPRLARESQLSARAANHEHTASKRGPTSMPLLYASREDS